MDTCYVEGCEKDSKYVIEWYGLNQFGKRPYIVDERPVCDNFEHIVKSSYHEEFGGFPDGIVDINKDLEQPGLVVKVKEAMN